MSLAHIASCALDGLSAPAVTVEAHLANGLPGITLVGLPEAEVRESRERVRAALQTGGFEWPARRITVNLAPADIPKESGRFDLPVAIAILAASGQIPIEKTASYVFAGELSLSGELRPIRGALAMVASYAERAHKNGHAAPQFILPKASAAEAARVSGATIYAASDLAQVCGFLWGKGELPLAQAAQTQVKHNYLDFADVKGQAAAKRALEIAAAGGHGVLMVGPPGTGKSMLASRFAGLLPPMTDTESLEAASVASLVGRFSPELWGVRPYRSPHHTASGVALVGGGSFPRPGEVSLAHNGVLFLDELPEFDRNVLEVLREPLESGQITISRAARRADFPARFQLIAAMNPCPCGYLGHPVRACRCTPDVVARYQGKVSGPLLDRIDVQITVPALRDDELLNAPPSEASSQIAERVAKARAVMHTRQGCANAQLQGTALDTHCAVDETAQALLKNAINRLGWSARATHRVLRLARTIADLEGTAQLDAAHIAESIQYRRGLKAGNS